MIDSGPRSVTIGVRTWLTAAAVFAGAYVLWLVLAGTLSAFVLLFTGILIAAALRPIVDRMSARMPFGIAVGLAFGGALLIAAVIAYVLIAPLGVEVQRLVAAIPGYVNSLKDQLVAAERFLKDYQLSKQFAGAIANGAGGAFTSVGAHLLAGPALIAAIIGNAIIILLLAVGWMLSSDDLERFTLSLFSPAGRRDWKLAFDTIGLRLSAYVKGIVINGTVVGVAIGGAVAILGVPYALLLGFVVAVFQAIPMVGAVISGPVVLLVVLATSGWVKMLIVLAIFTVVQILDQNVLSPIIFGQRVQLSFLLIIFSTVLGGMLLGIPGAFLAVPAAAVLQVIVVQIIAPAVRRANAVADPEVLK
ncbi:MAG TPA: AI-2E family transporter [Candidatus Cybelea sp.]|nr:AI-2E family transporter [Candidatus Cybelea sp.]